LAEEGISPNVAVISKDGIKMLVLVDEGGDNRLSYAYANQRIRMVGGAKGGHGEQGSSVRDQAKIKTGNRDITKAVLASPLVIPWCVKTLHASDGMVLI
jgi:hypothetical protein